MRDYIITALTAYLSFTSCSATRTIKPNEEFLGYSMPQPAINRLVNELKADPSLIDSQKRPSESILELLKRLDDGDKKISLVELLDGIAKLKKSSAKHK